MYLLRVLPINISKSSMVFIFFFICGQMPLAYLAVNQIFKIGAIFEHGDVAKVIALEKGIAKANEFLKNSELLQQTLLVPDVRYISKDDSFQALQEACSLIHRGIIAMIGPHFVKTSNQVQSVCETFSIPYFEGHWVNRQHEENYYSIHLGPHYSTYGEALLAYVQHLNNWKNLAIIYYHNESLLKFKNLLDNFKESVLIRRWHQQEGDYMYVLKNLRSAKIYRFLVDIPFWKVNEFLAIASVLNMTTQYYSYIFTSWDLQLKDLKHFKKSHFANISTITFLSTENSEQITEQIVQSLRKRNAPEKQIFKVKSTDIALIFDSMLLLAHSLNQLAVSQRITTTSLSCTEPQITWQQGQTLVNYIRSTSRPGHRGLSGQIEFDRRGYRSNLSFDIIEITSKNYQKFGKWNPKQGLSVIKSSSKTKLEAYKILKYKTLRVTTIESEPFVVIKKRDEKTNQPLSDPSAWGGFCIDLLNEIAKIASFNYTVHLVADNQYGSINDSNPYPDGSPRWNGLIQELIEHKADLAVASLTITYERQKVVDFTTPFMSLGLSILFKKMKREKPHSFSFLQPLSASVWGYIIAAYITVSFILFVIARFSPYEWYNSHLSNERNARNVENHFGIFNSLWFTISSFMQQDCSDLAPRAISTRIISGIWWFFTLIMISSYTANLAAFLTVERLQHPIENAESLSRQTEVKYGALKGGSTYNFFKKSRIDIYKHMWNFMDANPSVFVNTTAIGVQRVIQSDGKYAFILESTWNEYYTKRYHEDLMQVGGLLDSKGYGIGLPRGSPFLKIFDEIILQLQDRQKTQELQRLYWSCLPIHEKIHRSNYSLHYRIHSGTNYSTADIRDQETFSLDSHCPRPQARELHHNELRMEHIGGAFIFMLIGIIASFIVGIWEFQHKIGKECVKIGKPASTKYVCNALCRQIYNSLRCLTPSRRPTNYMHLEANEMHIKKVEVQGAGSKKLETSCFATASSSNERLSIQYYPHPMCSRIQGHERPYIAEYDIDSMALNSDIRPSINNRSGHDPDKISCQQRLCMKAKYRHRHSTQKKKNDKNIYNSQGHEKSCPLFVPSTSSSHDQSYRQFAFTMPPAYFSGSFEKTLL